MEKKNRAARLINLTLGLMLIVTVILFSPVFGFAGGFFLFGFESLPLGFELRLLTLFPNVQLALFVRAAPDALCAHRDPSVPDFFPLHYDIKSRFSQRKFA